MADTIIQLSADDFEEAMDFLDLVFSTHGVHDIARQMPLFYRPQERLMSCNYAIRRHGRLRAIVSLFPFEWHVGDAVLRVAFIGGVSSHRHSRGEGLMSILMEHCVGLMRAQGYHLSLLGGQRQRYLYFGYEKCGYKYSFTLKGANIKHCFAGEPGVRLEGLAAANTEYVARAKELYDAQPAHCQHSLEEFHLHCLNFLNQPFAAFAEDGHMVGYLVANEEGDQVTELCAEDEGSALQMLRAWIARRDGKSTTVEVEPLADRLVHQLGQICEQTDIHSSGNWQVFDWVATSDALMKMRYIGGAMAAGAVTVGIEGCGAVRLEVGEEGASGSTADGPCDVQCDVPTAMRLLFGPLPPRQVMSLPERAALLEAWCPLPLSWKRQDGR